MSALQRVTSRLDPRRLRVDGHPAEPAPLPPGGGQALSGEGLDARHEQLQRELAEVQFDLGGLTYEMAIRDHFRLDVLVRQAARLQELDAQLGTVEHLLALERDGAAGACPSCGSLYARGAAFCSNCGSHLLRTDVVPG